MLDGGQTLVLDFKTYNGGDGIHFSIEGGSCVGFDLELNGRPISTEKIYIGPEGRHPESNHFRECRG